MGAKGGAPSAPDYGPIAMSSEAAAQIQAQTSKDQLDWAKQQYADQAPTSKAYMQSMIDASDSQVANAKDDRSRYQSIYQPVENKFVQQATSYSSPERANQNAAGAQADVRASFDAQRQQSLQQLESYGIDPSQTRFGALDLGTRISEAAATAAAGTSSRRETEAMGLSLEGEAINIGRGYPGQVAQSYAGATSAGQAGVNAGLNTSTTYGNLMGTSTQWAGLANQSNGIAAGALNTGFNNQLGAANLQTQQGANTASGIGSLVGGAVAIGAIAI